MALFGSGSVALPPWLAKPNTNFNSPNGITGAYKSALQTNAGDYDKITQGYNDLLTDTKRPAEKSFVPINPKLREYGTNENTDNVIGQLSSFAQNGGYSDDDINALRARGTAPIRSAYATALKELNRQKSLSGGQMANQGAVLAKFAREKGYLLSDQATNINAGIAERVAQNKLASLQSLAPLASNRDNQRNQVDQYNTDLINELNKFNTTEQDRVDQMNNEEDQRFLDNKNRALAGMSSIYSASPGLVNTFGNQVLNDRNQVLNNNSQRASTGLQLLRSGSVALPSFLRRGA